MTVDTKKENLVDALGIDYNWANAAYHICAKYANLFHTEGNEYYMQLNRTVKDMAKETGCTNEEHAYFIGQTFGIMVERSGYIKLMQNAKPMFGMSQHERPQA